MTYSIVLARLRTITVAGGTYQTILTNLRELTGDFNVQAPQARVH